MEEPINEVDKNAVSLVGTNSHCRGEVIVYVQQKSPWLYQYFYPCPIALWASGKHVKHRHEIGLEIHTNIQSLHFHGTEKAIKLAKKVKQQRSKKT